LSKEVDEQHKGLNVKIYEPAFLPRLPSGLQFIHFVLLGLVLGVVLPAILIYVYQLLDSSVKSPDAIQRKLKVPALGMVPGVCSHSETGRLSRRERVRHSLVYLTFAGIAIIGILKLLRVD